MRPGDSQPSTEGGNTLGQPDRLHLVSVAHPRRKMRSCHGARFIVKGFRRSLSRSLPPPDTYATRLVSLEEIWFCMPGISAMSVPIARQASAPSDALLVERGVGNSISSQYFARYDKAPRSLSLPGMALRLIKRQCWALRYLAVHVSRVTATAASPTATSELKSFINNLHPLFDTDLFLVIQTTSIKIFVCESRQSGCKQSIASTGAHDRCYQHIHTISRDKDTPT